MIIHQTQIEDATFIGEAFISFLQLVEFLVHCENLGHKCLRTEILCLLRVLGQGVLVELAQHPETSGLRLN